MGRSTNDSVKITEIKEKAKRAQENRGLVRFVKLLDVLAVTAVFGIIWMHFYNGLVYLDPFYKWGNITVVILYMVTYYFLAHLYHGFLIHINPPMEIIFAQSLAAALSDALLYVITILLVRRPPNILPMLLCFLLDILVICLWSVLSEKWFFRTYAKKRTVLIYDELVGLEDLIMKAGLDKRYQVLDVISVKNVTPAFMDGEVQNAQIVFLCCIHSHVRNQIIKYCVAHDIKAFVIPRIGDVLMSGAERLHLLNLPMLLVASYDPTPEYLAIKRTFDIILSALALVILSPLMLILALVIRSDGGTALYRQTRLTRGGKKFDVLKFRSMRMDAEKDGVARLSTGENDPRITRVGRFIRKYRMDELPQLLNILKGDMSIVGPRPERPEIAEEYKKDLPEFDLRLQCKCGLTGYAQIYGKYNSTPYDKLLMDLMYIARPSFAEDIKIILLTVKILFKKDSTEGIAEGQTNACRKADSQSARN